MALFNQQEPWAPKSLADLLPPSAIGDANRLGLASPYASILRNMGYNWQEGSRGDGDSSGDPSGWFMGASERGDGAYNDPYANPLEGLYGRYDSETGNYSSSPFAYAQALGQFGYIPAGDPGIGSQWSRATPATLSWFNQNYGTNFTDPMSYMNYLYGPGGQLISDPNHGRLYKPPEGRGINDYVNRPLSYDPPDSGMFKWAPAIIAGIAGAGLTGMLPGTTSVFGGAGAGAGGVFGGDIAGTAFAGEGLSGGLGGGMGFFDDILGLASDEGFLPGSFELGESLYGGTAAQGLDLAAGESWLRNLVGGNIGLGDSLSKLLFGSNQNGLLGTLGGQNGILGSAVSSAPILAAINYARNQNPFDTSRLESLYSKFSPEAQAFQYDTNTGLGRDQLTSNLSRRGVSGSSFGDQSLTNYNTFRDLGRSSLINQGIGTQAGIAGQILGADVSERQMKNDLYGRALLALSGGLSPRISGGLFA